MAAEKKKRKIVDEEPVVNEIVNQETISSPQEVPEPVAPADRPREESAAVAQAKNRATLNDTPAYTAESLARTQETITPPNFEETRDAAMVEDRNRTFRQMMIEEREDAMRRLEEERQIAENERKAARMTGLAELGTSLVNLFGVVGGGVSQQYKTFSQDWMAKADADMRQHRNRVHDLRAKQRDTELKMAQLRMEGDKYLAQQRRQRELDNATIKLRQAQTEAQNATTVARMQEAERRASEAEKQLALLQAKVDAQNALADQRRASGQSSLIRAGAQASNVANQNKNRDKATGSKVNVDSSKIMKNLGQQSSFAWDPINGKYGVNTKKQENGLAFDENGFPTF